MLWLRYDLLPHADRHRERIVASIEKASGMAVDVRAIRGGWGGLRPVLTLDGLRISDRKGKAAFELERAQVSVSWWSLFQGQLRFDDVQLHRPQLELRRGADGLIYLADKPLNEGNRTDDGALTEWLLSQRRLAIHEATLIWRDDFLGLPEVSLAHVEIAVERSHGRHHAALTARPSTSVASSLDLRADVKLERRDDRWLVSGDVYGEAHDADLETIRRHLPVAEALRSGRANVRAWSRFTPEGVQELTADLNLRQASARLAADLLPLELASLSGRASYEAQPTGFTFATENLRFRLGSGQEAEPGRFRLVRSQPPNEVARNVVRADNIDLKIAAALLEYFPVPRDVKNQASRFAPRGRIRDAQLSWREQGAKIYSVQGRFEDLSINAVDAMPGLDGFDGTVEGTERGGKLTLDTKNARLSVTRMFSDPFVFDELQVRATWKPVGEALQVVVEDAHMVNAGMDARLQATWRSMPGTEHPFPGFLEMRGTLARADLTKAPAYLPDRMTSLRDYLGRSIVSGDCRRGSFELHGDLYQFPFGPGSEGRFMLEGDFVNARLRYHPDWPTIDGIRGNIRFDNRRLELRADRATIFGSAMTKTTAVIADLSAKPAPLVLQSDIETTGADTMRFLRESPLRDGPGAFTKVVSVDGPGRLHLKLDLPLGALENTRVAGEYLLDGDTAAAGRSVTMADVRGTVAFTEKGVRASDIAGSIFGRPATLALSTPAEGGVIASLEGQIDPTGLANYVPQPFVARMAGLLAWRARVASGRTGVDMLLESDLKGLASTLPAPLAKKPDEARPISIAISNLGTEREVTRAVLDGDLHGRFHRIVSPERGAIAEQERWQIAIRAGTAVAGEPQRDGLWLYGTLPAIDVDAWQAVFPAPPPAGDAVGGARSGGVELRGIDMRVGRARYLSRDFQDVTAKLVRDAGKWSGKLESPVIAGDVAWDPQGRGRLVAKLSRLAIPESNAANPLAVANEKDAELPALDVVAERFQFKGRELGKLALKAEPADAEWRIDRLNLDAPFGTMASSGVWRRVATGSLTTLALKLEVTNMNRLFAVFGHGDDLKRGEGTVTASLAWPGLPHEFDLASLAGTMRIDAKNGQFARIEPGAGKLLGLLSLQSLPRRAMLDFRDVFSDGFAFEKIEGDVRIARGVLLADNFEINGPAAFVGLSGEVSLPSETQALTVRVVPEVGEGMALAATVFGTPVLGLSTLLVSKLLKNPLGKVVAYEYQVTGSWDNPVVSRTSAAAPARAGPSPQSNAPAPQASASTPTP